MAKYSNISHVFGGETIQAIAQRLQLREQQIAGALADAVNTAASETIRLSEDEWNEKLQTSSRYVKGKIKITSKATRAKGQAIVSARSRATRADRFQFQVQTNRKGVRLNVAKDRSGAVIKNAFLIPRAKSNNRPLILERLKKYQKGDDRRFTQKRFRALYGPSVNQHFFDSRERVAPKAMSTAKEQFLRALQS